MGLDPNYAPSGPLVSKTAPQNDINSPNITCGRLAFDAAERTEIADVMAGTLVGFKSGQFSEEVSKILRLSMLSIESLMKDHILLALLIRRNQAQTPATNYVWHEGPVQMYMSRAESGNVKSYRGDGEWFKVAYFGPQNDTLWKPLGNRMSLVMGPTFRFITHSNRSAITVGLFEAGTDGCLQFNFTVPQTTPPGQYLLRIEQFMPSFFVGYVQSYINCAQINVIGPGGGSPESAGTARFPGTYTSEDPGECESVAAKHRAI